MALRVDRPLVSVEVGPGGSLVADRNTAVVRVPAVGAFGVEHGRRVVFEAAREVPAVVVDAWLRGYVAALVLAQRGEFALHANLVGVGDAVVAVAGSRGVGKTTTSLLLSKRGGRVLADDVVALRPDDDRVAYRTTGRPMRVAPETATALGLDLEVAGHADRAGKLLVRTGPTPPGRLDAIVVLTTAPARGVERERLAGRRALAAVHANLYRLRLLRSIWSAECFAWAGDVAARVPVHSVVRPAAGWTGDEVAAALRAVAANPGGG